MVRRVAIIVAILGAVCLTRIPLVPKYLYYFDAVNFTLALDEFNPALHQPQPPGYPFHVLFTRILHLFIAKSEHVFIAAGILIATLSIVLLWWLGETMFSARAGFAAALLLLLNPAFWLAGLSNQVRLWLAAGAAAVALACWRAVTARSPGPAFLAACALLGIVSGFRPAMLVFLLPLVVFTAVRARPALRVLIAGAGVIAATVTPWLWVTVHASGGWRAYIALVRGYAVNEFSVGSALLGAAPESAWHMFQAAVVWNGLGAISWIWILLVVRPSLRERPPLSAQAKFRALLIAMWFIPAFLFHSLIHVGDPDHTLITVSALCLAGGAAFAQLAGRLTKEGWLIANGLGAALNAILFFLPLTGLPGASGFRAVEYVDRATRDTFEAIQRLAGSGPVTLVCHNCFVTYRHLSYYLPEYPLIVLRQDYYHDRIDRAAVWRFRNRRLEPAEFRGDSVVLPESSRIIWLLSPHDDGARAALEESVDLRQEGPVFWTRVDSPAPIRFGGYSLIPTPLSLIRQTGAFSAPAPPASAP